VSKKKHYLCGMIRRILISVSAAVLAVAGALAGDKSQLVSSLDRLMGATFSDADAPGAAMLVMQGNDTLYSRCWGVADMETRQPVTLRTNFCIASVTKQLSAVAVLQLAEQGALKLTDPLSKFFPEFKAPFFKDITLHHIMSHTSGIPDARPRDDRNFVLHATDVASVQYMRTLDHLNFATGTQYEYINPTFQLIYQLVERVTGVPYETYMREHIFTPAGMATAQFFEPQRDIANMAHGYEPDGKGGWREFDYGEESFFATKADGGLYCSIDDFVRWERALRDNVVWTAASKRLAYTPWIVIPADADYGYQPHTGYGYGFFVQDLPGRPTTVYHTGDNGGFTIYAGKVPERDLLLLLFSTRNDIDRMGLVNAAYDMVFDYINNH